MTTRNDLTWITWNLSDLLKAGGVVGARRAQVLALARALGPVAVATAYVSWRLKAVSQPKLFMPGVWAATRLLEHEGAGAGDIHDQYAKLGPVVIAYLLHWARVIRTRTDEAAGGYELYAVDATRRELLNKQLTKFWGLFRRLWPVDLGLSALVERVAALGIELNVTQVRLSTEGDFYLAQPTSTPGQVAYRQLQFATPKGEDVVLLPAF